MVRALLVFLFRLRPYLPHQKTLSVPASGAIRLSQLNLHTGCRHSAYCTHRQLHQPSRAYKCRFLADQGVAKALRIRSQVRRTCPQLAITVGLCVMPNAYKEPAMPGDENIPACASGLFYNSCVLNCRLPYHLCPERHRF